MTAQLTSVDLQCLLRINDALRQTLRIQRLGQRLVDQHPGLNVDIGRPQLGFNISPFVVIYMTIAPGGKTSAVISRTLRGSTSAGTAAGVFALGDRRVLSAHLLLILVP